MNCSISAISWSRTSRKLVGVTTTTESNGGLNVFIGNGQPLVLQGATTTLTTVANQFNASQLEISTSTSNGNSISASISSGDLGGLLAARNQVINPALNQLGLIATAVAQSVNAQQASGLDLSGQFGANLFSVGAPVATASSKNTDNATASVSIANVGALTGNSYLLAYNGGAYTLTDTATGANVALAGAGTAANPLTADGLSIVLSATPAAGDQFLVQPTAQAAGSLSVALTNPSGIAAAGAVRTSAADTNAGTASIAPATVVTAANPNLLNTTTIQFLTPTTYSVNGAGSFAYTSGGNISLNGWQTKISGTPAAGDVFTVQSNAGGTGDNTQCPRQRQSAEPGHSGERHDEHHRGGRLADHRNRQPGTAGQYGTNGTNRRQHPGANRGAVDLRRESRRGGRESPAMATGVSGRGASTRPSATACSRP